MLLTLKSKTIIQPTRDFVKRLVQNYNRSAHAAGKTQRHIQASLAVVEKEVHAADRRHRHAPEGDIGKYSPKATVTCKHVKQQVNAAQHRAQGRKQQKHIQLRDVAAEKSHENNPLSVAPPR